MARSRSATATPTWSIVSNRSASMAESLMGATLRPSLGWEPRAHRRRARPPWRQTVPSQQSASSVLVAGARTPMGRLQGSLAGFSGADLGAVAIRGALAKAGVAPEQVQYVIMGQVLTGGAGQIPARQAAAKAGIPMTVPALTINKVCLSGIDAIALADQLIRAGEFEIVVAGGMESMTNAPHLMVGQRTGYKYGDVVVKDHMAHDGLSDAWDQCSMGESTERHNGRFEIS